MPGNVSEQLEYLELCLEGWWVRITERVGMGHII